MEAATLQAMDSAMFISCFGLIAAGILVVLFAAAVWVSEERRKIQRWLGERMKAIRLWYRRELVMGHLRREHRDINHIVDWRRKYPEWSDEPERED